MTSDQPKLRRSPPANRSYDQLLNHYLVEKGIAERLKNADRDERTRIYATMYDDLFAQVPDHPRLTRRRNAELTRRANERKFQLVRPYLSAETVFVEFAPGDCRFVTAVAEHVQVAYGVDISDQRGDINASPDNFELLVYDGYTLPQLSAETVHIVFSDDLIEHFHPEDTRLHFELVYRLLRPGGVYIFRTPHAFTGPHDISKYFSDQPAGFHLKEWTYRELRVLLQEVGFNQVHGYWGKRGRLQKLPYAYFAASESLLQNSPKRVHDFLDSRLLPSIIAAATK